MSGVLGGGFAGRRGKPPGSRHLVGVSQVVCSLEERPKLTRHMGELMLPKVSKSTRHDGGRLKTIDGEGHPVQFKKPVRLLSAAVVFFAACAYRQSAPEEIDGAHVASASANLQEMAEKQPDLVCGGQPATIVGTPGDDQLPGTPGNDIIVADAGNDHVVGFGGRDHVCAGEGGDRVELMDGSDFVDAGPGNDHVSTGGAGLTRCPPTGICAGPGDSIVGGTGEDRLEGGADSDILSGGDGDDLVFGQEESDRLMGGEGDDLLDGGEDNDIAFFEHATGPVHASLATGEATGWGEDRLASIEWLEGSHHADVLEGDNQTNEIRGNSGDDILLGLGGDDFLFGEEGADSLFGGDGDDFLNADETYDIPGPDRTDGGPGYDRCAYSQSIENCEN